jgi:hypothetical protein
MVNKSTLNKSMLNKSMVNKSKWYWIIFCGGMLITGSSNAGQLLLSMQQHHIQWGQALHAKLIAQGEATELSQIDLTTLAEDFTVIASDVHEDTAANVQSMNLELYPRRVGELHIPALNLADLKSQQQTVKVSNAMIHGTPLVVDFKVSAQQVWQRQQVLVTVEIKSPDRFFNIEADPFDTGSFEVRPFVSDRTPIEAGLSDPDTHYRSSVQAGWALFPLLGGEFLLEPPMIRYVEGGTTKRRFYLPRIAIQVRPLPAYIPPNMPVAKVNVTSEVMSDGLLRTGNIAYWNITLSADGTLAYWMPPVLRYLNSSSGIEYLPAKSRPVLHIDAGGAHALVAHEVPFKARRIGSVNLPPLKIQYFDPESGRIETVLHHPPTAFAWSVPVFVLIILLLLVILVRGRKRIIVRYSRFMQKRVALDRLQCATSGQDILMSLRQLAAAEGWPANITLSEFLRYWQQRYQASEELHNLFQRLTENYYGGRLDNVSTLRGSLIHQLRHARHRRRFKPKTRNFVWDAKNIFVAQVQVTQQK